MLHTGRPWPQHDCNIYGCTGYLDPVPVGQISGHFLLSGSGSGSDQNVERHQILQRGILLTYVLVNRTRHVGRK